MSKENKTAPAAKAAVGVKTQTETQTQTAPANPTEVEGSQCNCSELVQKIEVLEAKVSALEKYIDKQVFDVNEALNLKMLEVAQAVANSKQLTVTDKKAKPKEKALRYIRNGKVYGFAKHTPKTLVIDGQSFSQNQIMSNKELIESMIDSNNIFVKEIQNGRI